MKRLASFLASSNVIKIEYTLHKYQCFI